MSAIAGMVCFDGAPIEPGLLERMTKAMAARGPDGISHWRRGSVALGQCMLRTTPESLEEHQPLGSEHDRLVLVMDGRLDNREELRRELLAHGAVLRDCTDAELTLRAYEVWGEKCPDRLIGEFVFFVWDASRRLLFAARDAAGTRNFYYYAGDGWFGFASEIRGLLALELIEPRLNESRLLDSLVIEFDRDDQVGTFYQGIFRLPAGHAMRVTEQGPATWRYWDPADLSESRFASLEECGEAFLEQLRVAVKCRLRCNGPVGAMLSGGLDSSSIVGLIRKEFRHELAQPLMTFSLVREDREKCPEWRSIRRILEGGWIESTVLTPRIASDVWRELVNRIADLDEPFLFINGYFDALICEAARRKGCRVILDGMAGDLLFYWFDRSLTLRRETISRIPAVLQGAYRHRKPQFLWMLGWRALRWLTPEAIVAIYRTFRQRYRIPSGDVRLLHRETARRFLAARLSNPVRVADRFGPYNDPAAHARWFTSGLISFAHEGHNAIAQSAGMEPRSPFSDRRMIEFAVRMPLEAKICAGWYKLLLRKSMAGILPEEVRWRRDVDMHPGGDFWKGLISEISQGDPDLWNRARVERKMKKWIAPSSLGRAWRKHDRSGDLTTGLHLLALAVSTQWISSRFHGGQHGEATE